MGNEYRLTFPLAVFVVVVFYSFGMEALCCVDPPTIIYLILKIVVEMGAVAAVGAGEGE
jgi:Ethanolamine utilization protein EutJ (predicted chaperonin)